MKFWQYIVGTGLAILIFSGAVFSEYSKYQKVSFLEKNPFSLTGEHNYHEKGYDDFIKDNGELIRIFKDSQVKVNGKFREIISGKVFLGGSFFDEDLNNNTIKFGNLILKYPGSNVIISRDSDSKTTQIINYGKTIELFFPNEEIPFLIPSETTVLIPDSKEFSDSKNIEYYKYSKLFHLDIIDWSTDLSKQGKQSSEDLYNFRNSFKIFATQLPNLWEKDKLYSLKSIDILKRKKSNNAYIEDILFKIFEAKKLIQKGDKLSKNLAKVSILEAKSKINSNTKELLDLNNEWNLFQKSQKIWLPNINDTYNEWIYLPLWQSKKDDESLTIILDLAEFFNYSIVPESTNKQIIKLGEEITNNKTITAFEISSLRRRFFYLLKNKINDGEIVHQEVIDIYLKIEKKELDIYKDNDSLKKITREKILNILELINMHIDQEDNFSRNIVKSLIGFLQKETNLDLFRNDKIFKEKEQLSILKKIDLVGVSGLTPDEVLTINSIKNEEEELNKSIKTNNKESKADDYKSVISTSKILWGFLREEGINIDITKFRTLRSSLKLETKFENTEVGKNRIHGLFDYNGQIFKRLELGTASIRNLQPHALSVWLKDIEGKFEPVIKNEKPLLDDPKDYIPQNSRKAIVNKQFLKDLLDSLGFKISKKNITIISKDLLQLSASHIQFLKDSINGNDISLEFNIEDKEFYNVFIEKNKDKIYLSEKPIDGKTLQEKSREFFKSKEKGD